MTFRRCLPLLILVVVAACGDPEPPLDPSTLDVLIEARDIDFDQDTYELFEGEAAIGYVQRGAIRHSLLIEDQNGNTLDLRLVVGGGTGDQDLGTVTLAAGRYSFFCDIAGHRAAGMEAELIVISQQDPTEETTE